MTLVELAKPIENAVEGGVDFIKKRPLTDTLLLLSTLASLAFIGWVGYYGVAIVLPQIHSEAKEIKQAEIRSREQEREADRKLHEYTVDQFSGMTAEKNDLIREIMRLPVPPRPASTGGKTQ